MSWSRDQPMQNPRSSAWPWRRGFDADEIRFDASHRCKIATGSRWASLTRKHACLGAEDRIVYGVVDLRSGGASFRKPRMAALQRVGWLASLNNRDRTRILLGVGAAPCFPLLNRHITTSSRSPLQYFLSLALLPSLRRLLIFIFCRDAFNNRVQALWQSYYLPEFIGSSAKQFFR
jgi:hypothetical protein